MARINLQVYRHNARLLRSLQDRSHERGPDAAMPAIRRDIKLFEPRDRTAMLRTQNRGDIRNADNSAVVPRQHEETARHVCGRGLQQAGQGIWRRRDAMLSELVD